MTVLLLPLGATEPHGPHAPLETDTLISVGICTRAGERLTDDPDVRALVLPAAALRSDALRRRLPGRHLDRRGDAARARRRDLCVARAPRASARIVLVNNHLEPEQLCDAREAVEELGWPSATST